MMKKTILITILVLSIFSAMAEELKNDIITVNYEKKSASRAMLMSSLFPGAGQFYADRSSITTYLFPIIEIGLWVGYFTYYQNGLDKEEDYEYWANQENINPDPNGEPIYRYDRERYNNCVDDFLTAVNFNAQVINNSYDNHFRLDETNTQHFYEDIAKYDKYILGWLDWYDIYMTNPDTGGFQSFNLADPTWNFNVNSLNQNYWVGNHVQNPDSPYYDAELYPDGSGWYSAMRQEYIDMRADAEEEYDKARLCNYGIIFNHMLAALDAVRLVKKHNLGYLSQNPVSIKLAPMVQNNTFTPSLQVQVAF